jgi:hypothetical protein
MPRCPEGSLMKIEALGLKNGSSAACKAGNEMFSHPPPPYLPPLLLLLLLLLPLPKFNL